MMSPSEFAAKVLAPALVGTEALSVPTEAFMEKVRDKAKSVIGTYAYGWPELADRTKEDRAALGYPENEPLLRGGDLRDSIEIRAEPTAIGAEGLVYSDKKTALWAELGTVTQPPRSFLMQSLIRSDVEMGEVFGAFAEKIFAR